jgi:hypothetical protein
MSWKVCNIDQVFSGCECFVIGVIEVFVHIVEILESSISLHI